MRAVAPCACGPAEVRALLGVFERFPEEDGYGIFWGIVHALEACPGYETEVIESVRRKPCEFNVLLIVRMLSSGITVVDGTPLDVVLRSVQSSAAATAQAVEDAMTCLELRKPPA